MASVELKSSNRGGDAPALRPSGVHLPNLKNESFDVGSGITQS
jgi:hypothetical protein